LANFGILHLSDLHIKEDNSDTRDKLITDTIAQIKDIKEIMIIVTGDIIDQVHQNLIQRLVIFIITFFKELKINQSRMM